LSSRGIPAASSDVLARAAHVRLLALDVDGVLCPPQLEYSVHGEEHKRFHVRDGVAIRLLLDAGIQVAVVSGRSAPPMARRVRELGIEHAHYGCADKLAAVRALATELGLALAQVCFVGDDLLDVPVLEAVGLPICVADGHFVARREALWVTPAAGGQGCVREVADLLLHARGNLDAAYLGHLRRELARAHGDAPPRGERNPEPEFAVIIPARYASTRLPGKPLRELAGVPMIARVYENARRSGARSVTVATDDDRIAAAVERAGGVAILTSDKHPSGLDRLAEVVARQGLAPETVVVNLQGDEPLLPPELLRRVAGALAEHPLASLATLATPVQDAAQLFDPHIVKVVLARDGRALYFSRAPIPWDRQGWSAARWDDPASRPSGALGGGSFLRHIGLYAYRAAALLRLAKEPTSALEQLESLEQLRALELGLAIQVEVVADAPPPGVDVESDIERVSAILRSRGEA
jgi:3-deoxy-manno-octulosonate cytidylyltransferase (CMP-KDO synthetase)